jgi:hypothetical protein
MLNGSRHVIGEIGAEALDSPELCATVIETAEAIVKSHAEQC